MDQSRGALLASAHLCLHAVPDMDWGVLLFGFMAAFATIYYIIVGRHVYVSPKERLRRDLHM